MDAKALREKELAEFAARTSDRPEPLYEPPA
jgi:hypothetical protein